MDDLRQEAFWRAVAYAHQHQQSLFARRVPGKGNRPLSLRKRRREIVRREDGNGALGVRNGFLNFQHKVRSGSEVPGLKHRRVSGLLQMPCYPFGPGAVRPVVADEEVLHNGPGRCPATEARSVKKEYMRSLDSRGMPIASE